VLVLVSFVLVLAAAVTLVVGLLQSGLTLIYLSIGCSVLAGVVLAVAVLRGRPEPKAAPIGRPFTPPASAPPVPASVGAPASSATETTSFTPPPPAPSTPPPPSPTAAPARGVGDDAATKAAGTALLGRLRGRRSEEPPVDTTPEPEPAVEVVSAPEPVTTEMPAVSAEADDDFPIADYDKLRATDLLRRLGSLDRNQLEAVRERETAGKNRFTILSRVDVLLAAQAEPAWQVDDDEWEPDGDVAAGDAVVIPVGPVVDDDDDLAAGEIEDDEADEVDVDEVDELVSPVDAFPIAGYESLTVGQILPRLSDLSSDELAQVRAREQQGRARGTILDRIERLAAKSGAMAMPAPGAPARKSPATRKAPARKAPVRKAATAIPVPPATTTTPMKEAVKKASARQSAAAAKAPGPVVKSPAGRKAASPVVKKAPAKSPARRKAVAPVAPIAPAETAAPTKAAVKKKARAAKATKRP
jgi:hypothetical protein